MLVQDFACACLSRIHATLWNPLKFQRFCCPCAYRRCALHSFARFLWYGTQQKSEPLRPHHVRTSRQKLSDSTVTSCFFAFNKPLNYIYTANRMQAFFEMFFEYFWGFKSPEKLEIMGFWAVCAWHCIPRFLYHNSLCLPCCTNHHI